MIALEIGPPLEESHSRTKAWCDHQTIDTPPVKPAPTYTPDFR